MAWRRSPAGRVSDLGPGRAPLLSSSRWTQQRGPCLIGTARHTWHPDGEPAPEPLDMWVRLARAAAEDIGIDRDALAEVDDLSVVHCQSWAYDDPPLRLAERLGLESAHRSESILAGTSPQRLIDAAAERMLRGETSVALVVGGEALATRREFAKVGDAPPWSHPHPTPPLLPVELDEWYLPTEIAHGVLPAWLTFALLDQARWASRGGRPEDRTELAAIMDRLNAVAAQNPDAWFRERRGGDEIVTPGPDNRMVTTPYTKRMTAFMDVDMGAATSAGDPRRGRRLGRARGTPGAPARLGLRPRRRAPRRPRGPDLVAGDACCDR